jgi:hypothetical protein
MICVVECNLDQGIGNESKYWDIIEILHHVLEARDLSNGKDDKVYFGYCERDPIYNTKDEEQKKDNINHVIKEPIHPKKALNEEYYRYSQNTFKTLQHVVSRIVFLFSPWPFRSYMFRMIPMLSDDNIVERLYRQSKVDVHDEEIVSKGIQPCCFVLNVDPRVVVGEQIKPGLLDFQSIASMSIKNNKKEE